MSSILILLALVFSLNNVEQIQAETVNGCTVTNHNRAYLPTNRTFVTLTCFNGGFILVKNLTFGVHQSSTTTRTCSYQPGDCLTRTTYIGMECNGLTSCRLDLNPQYLHICSQYSDYMVLDYLCLQGQSLSVCDNRMISTIGDHRTFLRSPNYPQEYESALNCSCSIQGSRLQLDLLDFYLEERDEINQCTRDYLQIDDEFYCDSDSIKMIERNSSVNVKFQTNDVITRKGFWLMITGDQSISVSCHNQATPFSLISTTSQSTTTFTSSSNSEISLFHGLILFVIVVLLIFNFILFLLCWKQRKSKEISKHRPILNCSKRSSESSSSTSSSMSYHNTLELPKSTGNYLFRTVYHSDATPSTSITTDPTGVYEDPTELVPSNGPHNHETMHFCPLVHPSCSLINNGCSRTLNCHCSLSAYAYDSSHVYETIKERSCSYQRFANATLCRPCPCQSSCSGQNAPTINNPETLV